ncbi:hypothetical protein L3Q82_012514%2C partial [Scomber scombrus]|uniref:LNR domain-containing protein n=1 Tax=Scomber scombrus TaxID=13677 RepID=A0AAV1MX68_SCOSC
MTCCATSWTIPLSEGLAKTSPHLQKWSPLYDQYCKGHSTDGHYDHGCSNAEYEWDGLNCTNNMPEKLAEGHLVLVVHIPPEQLKKHSSSEISAVFFTLMWLSDVMPKENR